MSHAPTATPGGVVYPDREMPLPAGAGAHLTESRRPPGDARPSSPRPRARSRWPPCPRTRAFMSRWPMRRPSPGLPRWAQTRLPVGDGRGRADRAGSAGVGAGVGPRRSFQNSDQWAACLPGGNGPLFPLPGIAAASGRSTDGGRGPAPGVSKGGPPPCFFSPGVLSTSRCGTTGGCGPERRREGPARWGKRKYPRRKAARASLR